MIEMYLLKMKPEPYHMITTDNLISGTVVLLGNENVK